MSDLQHPDLKERFEDINRRIDDGLDDSGRAAVKAEIVALFRTVEQQLSELTVLKDEVKKLAGKWKTHHAPATPSLAPPFSADRPVTRSDHLGASTFIEQGWSQLSLGDYDGAEASLTTALDLVPGDPNAQALLGWAQMLNEKHDEALLNFQRVLIREPQNSLARINVGYICLKKKIFTEAIEHLSRTIRLGQDKRAVLYAHFYLGLVYFDREMYEDAENFFLKALALGPNLVQAYYELGRTYWFSGQRDEAASTWQRGVAANKFSPWGKRCAEILASVDAGGAPSRA
ncbi:MAG TPA: tetratricopeptide repeat protein [Gemmatimonadaceae bacterium]|nr:tetratricopeptide repeat protein [Gemmatimonadaceae bacterium]